MGASSQVIVSPTSTTTYTVTGTTLGCTGTASVTVTVNSVIPSITTNPNPASICSGSSVTLTASGANSYSWCCGLGNSNQVTVSPTSTTTYTVTGTTSGCTGTASQTITVNALPIVTASATYSTACINWTTDLLTGTPSGGTFSGIQVTGTNFNPSLAGSGIFTITYHYTDGNGCTNTATTNITVNLCTGINENIKNNFIKIYPNPADDNIIIEIPEKATIEISNIQGQLIKTLAASGTKTNVDVSALPCGVYVVEVKMGKGVAIKKFVKD